MIQEMTSDQVNQGFAIALSKLFGPGVMVELMEHAMNAPPKEPCVLNVAEILLANPPPRTGDKCVAMQHEHLGKVCDTPRIRGSVSRCTCGCVLWDDR